LIDWLIFEDHRRLPYERETYVLSIVDHSRTSASKT